eukprot:TRINITY_DN3515_c0_g1_i1.p1 TRINITY_DN3515_c0_g1~~TRINITY_DN3515_c0_g1_i1.p1  ORF type:complete len:304 (+),score=86.15 TRINITY_DN3515_c0_g1_i1:78-989(+)
MTSPNLSSPIVPFPEELKTQLERLRKKRNFQVEDWVNQKTDLFNDYMKKNGLKACVVNVSGGIDSACTVALAKAAQKKPGSPIQRIVGIAQPILSTQTIQSRAYELQKAYDIELITVQQDEVFTMLKSKVDSAIGIPGNIFATGQLKSYMRTPVAYYTAQLITSTGLPCVVLGTGNKDEDGYLFYFCKAGDGVSDIQLINDLHKSEVFKVSHYLNVPESILKAKPSADLWENQTDEEELGFTYDFVELLLLYTNLLSDEEKTQFVQELSPAARDHFTSLSNSAKKIHERNRHKEKFPVNLNLL